MTNYNDGKWHGWNGGECPVHPQSRVEWMNRRGDPWRGECIANLATWDDGIVAFRVIKEHREPREWWVLNGVAYETRDAAQYDRAMYLGDPLIPIKIIHVREVLE